MLPKQPTFPETKISTENRPFSIGNLIFQPSIFRGELLVLGRVCHTKCLVFSNHPSFGSLVGLNVIWPNGIIVHQPRFPFSVRPLVLPDLKLASLGPSIVKPQREAIVTLPKFANDLLPVIGTTRCSKKN